MDRSSFCPIDGGLSAVKLRPELLMSIVRPDALGHKKRNGERVGNIQFGYRLAKDGKHVEPDPG